MMVAAQQDSVCHICTSAIPNPLLHVMGFGPRWWPVTSGEPATAVPRRQRYPLTACKEPLLSTHIQRLGAVEKNRHHGARTGEPLHSLNGDRIRLPLEAPMPDPGREGGGCHQHAHRRRAGAQQVGIVCGGTVTQKLEEHVRRELLGGTWVGEDPLSFGLEFPTEPGPTPARGSRPVVELGGDRGGLGVEEPREPPHPIRLPGESERATVSSRALPVCDTELVEFVTELAGPPEEAVWVEGGGLRDQLCRSSGQHRDRHVRGRFAQP